MSTSARDPEFYLSHADYVRALARRLVYDPDAADDLFQEAWLAALERPPRDLSAPRRWLCALVKNLASKRWVANDRRRAREILAAQSEPSSSPDEVLAHESERRRVVEALLQLDEPYRSTLIQVFFDGLALREIAAREGLSIETVRTRQKRGIQRLRAKLRLERALGAWLVARLDLGFPSWPSVAQRIAKGFFVVSTVKKVAIAIVMFAVVWFGARSISSSLESVAGASVSSAAASLEKSNVAPVDAPKLANERDSIAIAPADVATTSSAARAKSTTGELVAHIRWASDRTPAADIALRATPYNSQNAEIDQREARSDEHGVARIAELKPGTVFVALDRGVSAEAEVIAGRRTDIELEIPVGARVHGRVLDLDRRPIAGAQIDLSVDFGPNFREVAVARSDANGDFAVRDVPVGRDLVFSARAALRAPSSQRAVVAKPGDDLEIELAFEAMGGALRGRVVDAAGTPIARAAVVVGYDFSDLDYRRAKASRSGVLAPTSTQRGFTDEHGEYRFDSLADGDWPIAIGAPKFAVHVDRVSIERERESVHDAALELGSRLEGSVLDEHGAPIAKAGVHVGRGGMAAAFAQSASDGSFALDGLPIGEFDVHAALEGRGEASTKLVGASGALLHWDAKLSRDRTLRIQIVAPGRKLENWSVCANAMNYAESNFARSVATDAQGRVELTNCPDALLHVYVTSPTSNYFPVASLDDVDPNVGALSIEIDPKREPSARIAGRAVDGAGHPIAGATVTMMPTALDTGGASAVAGDDGRFVGPAIPAGAWRIGVLADGFASRWTESRAIAADATTDLGDIALEHGGGVEALVTADDGIDLASVQICLLESELSLGVSPVKDGVAKFESIASGRYRLIAYGRRVALGLVDVEVRDGELAHAEMHLTQGAEVTVAIVDAAGHDAAERVEGRLEDPAGRVIDTGPTLPGPNGTRWIRSLASGHYRLRLSDHRARQALVELELDLSNGAPREFTATLR